MSEESLRIEPEAHQSLFRDALPIPRLDAEGDWDELSADGTPFILTGRTAGWRSRTWSFEHFRETYGAASILTSRNARNSAVSYYWPPDCHRISTTCRDFVDAMLDHPEQEIYLWKRTIEQFPGLNEDFSFEQIKPGRGTPTYTNIWLSTAGSRSGLHFDRHDNIFAQMVGQKSVLLLPPEEASRIYPFHDFIERSRIDPEYVDVHLFPKALSARAYHGVVGEGELLFIPQLWWHYLRALAPSISLNYWYGEPASLWRLAGMVRRAGVANVGRVSRDFLWHGLLRQRVPESNKPVPTGKDIYSWVSSGVRRRLAIRSPA